MRSINSFFQKTKRTSSEAALLLQKNDEILNNDKENKLEKTNLEIAKHLKANCIKGAEGMSPEWKMILSQEFNKLYFKDVNFTFKYY